MVCADEDLPIYMVANQASLKEISTFLPLTKKDLLQISGFGKAKVDKYGDDIIAATESYCERFNLESRMKEMVRIPKRAGKEKSSEKKIDTKIISYNLYKEGKTIVEIAKENKPINKQINTEL